MGGELRRKLSYVCQDAARTPGPDSTVTDRRSRPMMESKLKRRTLKKFTAAVQQHHNVYVVLLDPAVAKWRRVRAENPNRDPSKPCVYVGMTGLSPEERFANHKKGNKSAGAVKRYGIRLLPELFAHLNSMPYEAAVQMEKDLAEDLREEGYTVTGGH